MGGGFAGRIRQRLARRVGRAPLRAGFRNDIPEEGLAGLKLTQSHEPVGCVRLIDRAGTANHSGNAVAVKMARLGASIVELSPDGIAPSAETYFAQSEQLPTAIRLAAAPLYLAGEKEPRWRAGGLMLQLTPEAAKDTARNEDDWNRLSLLLKTVEDLELVDTAPAPETVLWRLFHEDEVRVQPAEPIAFRCDCDAARITMILKNYAPEERAGLADPDGIIRARCEFCGKTHEIGPDALG